MDIVRSAPHDHEGKSVVTGIHYLLGRPVMKSASNDHRIVRAITDRNVTFREKASSSLVPPGGLWVYDCTVTFFVCRAGHLGLHH